MMVPNWSEYNPVIQRMVFYLKLLVQSSSWMLIVTGPIYMYCWRLSRSFPQKLLK